MIIARPTPIAVPRAAPCKTVVCRERCHDKAKNASRENNKHVLPLPMISCTPLLLLRAIEHATSRFTGLNDPNNHNRWCICPVIYTCLIRNASIDAVFFFYVHRL